MLILLKLVAIIQFPKEEHIEVDGNRRKIANIINRQEALIERLKDVISSGKTMLS